MYQNGQVPDHVHRSYLKQKHGKYIEPIPKAVTGWSVMCCLLKTLVIGAFILAVCMFVAMYIMK
jgi:ABC-type transporter Mla maintaining outer membrane lipid asymmetry permease subunit MlaE